MHTVCCTRRTQPSLGCRDMQNVQMSAIHVTHKDCATALYFTRLPELRVDCTTWQNQKERILLVLTTVKGSLRSTRTHKRKRSQRQSLGHSDRLSSYHPPGQKTLSQLECAR